MAMEEALKSLIQSIVTKEGLGNDARHVRIAVFSNMSNAGVVPFGGFQLPFSAACLSLFTYSTYSTCLYEFGSVFACGAYTQTKREIFVCNADRP